MATLGYSPGNSINIKLLARAGKSGRGQALLKVMDVKSVLGKSQCITSIWGIPIMHISSYDTEDPVEVGQETIYVVEVRNEGTAPRTNVVIKDLIGKKMTFISATGPTPYKIEGNCIIFEPVPILKPGENLSIVLFVELYWKVLQKILLF